MIQTARLTGEPEQVGGVWQVEGVWLDDGVNCTLRFTWPAQAWAAYHEGDRVLVALPYGDHTCGRILGHLEVPQVTPTNVDNHEIRAREGASVRVLGNRVDLGEGEPSEQEQIACHPDVSAQIVNLKAQIDALATTIAALTYLPGPGTPTPVTGAAAAPGAVSNVAIVIDGGKAASNVYAKPEAGV